MRKNGKPQTFSNLAVGMVQFLFLTAPVTAQIPCSYDVQIIASPLDCGLGTVNTVGLGLNENGAVVGYYKCPLWNHTEAFLWTADGGFVTLQRPQGVSSAIAVDINDEGIICGTVFVSGLDNRGFVYENGEWTILPPVVDVPGARSSAAAINNAGVVAGQRSLTEEPNPQNAYIWSAEKGFTDLGVMKGGVSRATGITERGDVVGSTGGLASPGQEAFLWQDGELILLGYVPQGISSWAIAVSSHGKIAGGGLMDPDKSDLPGQPAFWEDGIWELLGVLPGCDIGGSRDANDLGMVVGSCTEPDNTKRAFVWAMGRMFDLNDLVPKALDISLQRAKGINDAGQIVTDGDDEAGENVSFLLTPTVAPLGDLDGDCVVGVSDLLILLGEWGQRDSPADLNGDGIVGVKDLLILLGNWG